MLRYSAVINTVEKEGGKNKYENQKEKQQSAEVS